MTRRGLGQRPREPGKAGGGFVTRDSQRQRWWAVNQRVTRDRRRRERERFLRALKASTNG